MTDTRKAQLDIGVNAAPAEQGFARVEQAGAKMAKGLSDAAKQSGESIKGLAKESEQASKKLGDESDKLTAKQERAYGRFEAMIKRQVAAQQAMVDGTGKTGEIMNRMLSQGLDPARLNDSLAALRALEAAQGSLGVSAKQTAAALRGVPAQFTDIITSLQGGQAPLTVLLQQGGQLKDMFGGVGAAARALGGYVAGLVSPLTVATGAVAALGAAAYLGSKESENYAKALILSGNAAGATVGQLQGMARAMAQVSGTQGAAAEALAIFAQTAKVGRSDLQSYTQAAMAYSKATGQSIADVAKSFADLARDPLQATLKLNDGMNYLTMSTYQQIKALEEQGRKTDAANLAQKAFADTLESRGKEIQQNLGSIERGWDAVGRSVAKVWDAMKGIGRELGAEDQLKVTQSTLEASLKKRAEIGEGSAFAPALDKEIAKLRERESILQSDLRLIQRGLDMKETERKLVDAQQDANRILEKHMGDQERMKRELLEVESKLIAAGVKQVDIERTKAQIRASYAKKTPEARVESTAEVDNLRARVVASEQYLTALRTMGAEADKLTEGEKLRIKIKEELNGKLTDSARKTKEAALAEAERLVASEKAIAQEKERIRLSNDLEQANVKALEGAWKQVDAVQSQIDAQRLANQTFGQGKSALAELTLAELEHQMAALKTTVDIIPGQVEALQARIDKQRELIGLMKDGELLDANEKAAKATADAWRRYSDQINQSLTDALMRGFESGKSFARNLRDSIVNMFQTMVLRPVVQAVVGGVTGLGGASAFAGMPGAAGQAAQMMGVGSTLSNVYSTITGSFAALGNSVAFAAQDMGAWLVQNTTGVLNRAGTSLRQGSGAMGTVASYAGGALAGYGLGKAISGQYSTGLGKNTLEIGGTALGAIFGGPLGAAVGGAIGGTLNRAFGMGAKSVTGSGLTGTFNADTGADVSQYTDWFQKGGWFRSNKSGRNYSAIGSDLDQFLDGAIQMTATATREYAKAIGLSADAVKGFSKSISISLQGLDAAGREKAIADAISGFGNSMAEQLLGTFTTVLNPRSGRFGAVLDRALGVRTTTVWNPNQFVREGETAAQALNRLATSLMGVNDVLKSLDQVLLSTNIVAADAASQLAELFGGMEGLTNSAGAYLQAYYTDMERFRLGLGNIGEMLAKSGVDTPKTTEAYRALIEAQDLTTEAGRRAYAALMQLAPAFAEVTRGIQAQLDGMIQQRQQLIGEVLQERDGLLDNILKTMGRTGEMRGRELSRLDPVNRPLQEFLYALEDARAASDALTSAQTALADAQESTASRLVNAGSGLANFIATLRAGTTGGRANAAATYAADLAAARGGDVAASERLPASAQAYRDMIRAQARSATEVDIAMSRMANELEALPATVSYAEQQVKELQKIQDALTKGSAESVKATATMQAALIDVLSKGFAGLDKNIDGTLTFEELKAGLAGIATDAQIRALIDRVDANGDGQISRLELLQNNLVKALSVGFAGIDLNVNGMLTFEELKNGLAGIASDEQIKALIKAVDTNGDGQISKLESVTSATKAVDTNTAGLLDGSDEQVLEMRRMVAATDTNSSLILKLNGSIYDLTAEVAAQNAERRKQAQMAAAEINLEGAAKERQALIDSVNAGIKGIWNLAGGYGLRLGKGPDGSANDAYFKINDQGLFDSQYNSIWGNVKNFAPFKDAFYKKGGVYDQTYGMADDLIAAKEKLEKARQAVRDMGGIPKFAAGGYHSGGARIVGERGPELEITGPSYIANAQQTMRALQGGNNAELAAEVRALRTELRTELEGLRAEARATAISTGKTARTLDRVTQGTDTILTQQVAA